MNKKIKVIELLNKIANNEKLPVKIMFNTVAWELMKDEKDYRSTHTQERLLKDDNWILRHLNVEVEILEDEKETGISKLEKEKVLEENPAEFRYELKYYYNKEKMGDKINEIIEKVNKLDKKINKED